MFFTGIFVFLFFSGFTSKAKKKIVNTNNLGNRLRLTTRNYTAHWKKNPVILDGVTSRSVDRNLIMDRTPDKINGKVEGEERVGRRRRGWWRRRRRRWRISCCWRSTWLPFCAVSLWIGMAGDYWLSCCGCTHRQKSSRPEKILERWNAALIGPVSRDSALPGWNQAPRRPCVATWSHFRSSWRIQSTFPHDGY